MVIQQGDVWWADLPAPAGSEAGFRRPVVVVQCDPLNRSSLSTVVCVPLTTNLDKLGLHGHVGLSKEATGLPMDSVVEGTLIVAANRGQLSARVKHLSSASLDAVFLAIDQMLGR